MTIEFRDPPPDGRASKGSSDARELASALKANPGVWAYLGVTSSSQAYNITRGKIKAYQPAGTFEATVRIRDDGKHDLYARYIGEKEATP